MRGNKLEKHMRKNYNPNLKPYSRTLRREMTKEEKHLWYDFLKDLPVTVKRQKIVGKYILDFYIAEYSLAIELDGSQHYEDEGFENDKIREEYLNNRGIRVIRYTNLDIQKRFDAVCRDIMNEISLLPLGRRWLEEPDEG